MRLDASMSAPREMHVAATSQLGAGAERAGGLRADQRQTFALRLDRFWPDLEAAVAEVHPDPEVAGALLTRLVRAAAAAYAERPADLHQLDQRRLLTPDWLQQPEMFGYACYADRFAGDLTGRRQAPRPPRGARRHLPAPDAAAAAQGGRQRRGLRRAGLPRGPARPRHHRGPPRPRDDTARSGSQPGRRPGPQPRRPRARLGGARPRRRARLVPVPRLLPRLRRPRPAGPVRADPARGVPRLRAGQLHLGRRARGLGLDDVQRVAVGPQLGQPRRAGRVRGDHLVAGQPRASRSSGSTPSRSSGSGWAPPARTSPRCMR